MTKKFRIFGKKDSIFGMGPPACGRQFSRG
jgi:hypothetical protein